MFRMDFSSPDRNFSAFSLLEIAKAAVWRVLVKKALKEGTSINGAISCLEQVGLPCDLISDMSHENWILYSDYKVKTNVFHLVKASLHVKDG